MPKTKHPPSLPPPSISTHSPTHSHPITSTNIAHNNHADDDDINNHTTPKMIHFQRMSSSRSQGGAETTVVTAFYSLILLTSTLRTLWFLIPSTVWSPYYTPHATMAFDSTHTNPQWKMTFIEILLQGAGSLSLFSIFILILVYWADILKKYFYPGARRTKPMTTFFALVSILALIQLINAICFLLQEYSSEGMILVNSITLSIVSMVCVCEITIFSLSISYRIKNIGRYQSSLDGESSETYRLDYSYRQCLLFYPSVLGNDICIVGRSVLA